MIDLSGIAGATADEAKKYPNWEGMWKRGSSVGVWDPTKPGGLGQQPPLTAEYQAVLEASLAEQAAGGQGNNPMGECIPPGMPRTMIDYEGMEIVVTPQTTYVMLLEPMNQLRRIYTDGRSWPDADQPAIPPGQTRRRVGGCVWSLVPPSSGRGQPNGRCPEPGRHPARLGWLRPRRPASSGWPRRAGPCASGRCR